MTGPARPRGEKGEKGEIGPKGMPGATGGPGKMGETGPKKSRGKKKDMRESRPTQSPGKSISASQVMMSPADQTRDEGHNMSFYCRAGGNPTPSVEW